MILQQDAFGTELIGTALGNGNGTFQALRTQTGSSVLENLRISDDLEVGDLNGDGTRDLLVFNYASNDVSVFLSNPDGSLQPHQRYGIGNTPQLGTMADFDGDGRIDVAAAIGLPPSGIQNAIVVLLSAGAPIPQSAFSRKVHGAAGTFDIPLPLTGNMGIECRSGGASNDYQMIINFATSVTVQSASLTSGTGSVSSFSFSGPQVTVNLTGVTNVQRIIVTLIGVNDGTHMGNVPVSMGVLVGDVNGNAAVNASDVIITKAQVGQLVSGSNFREDVNVNGTINVADVALSKAKVGTALPPEG
jgi:hypothetical protein